MDCHKDMEMLPNLAFHFWQCLKNKGFYVLVFGKNAKFAVFGKNAKNEIMFLAVYLKKERGVQSEKKELQGCEMHEANS